MLQCDKTHIFNRIIFKRIYISSFVSSVQILDRQSEIVSMNSRAGELVQRDFIFS